MGRSKRTHAAAWHYLLACLQPDVAMVQEALASADSLAKDHGELLWSGLKRQGTAMFVRRGIEFTRLPLPVKGSYVSAITTSVLGSPTQVVSIHVGPEKWQNQEVLREALIGQVLPAGRFVIGGDLNTSRSFSPRHQRYLDGLVSSGFYDYHIEKYGKERPSFWGRQARREYRDDYILTDRSLAPFISRCDVIDNPVTRHLSDHGPVVLDLGSAPALTC